MNRKIAKRTIIHPVMNTEDLRRVRGCLGSLFKCAAIANQSVRQS